MHDLIGTWRLVSAQMAFTASGERIDLYGAEPQGVLIMTAARMAAMITAPDRQALHDDSAELYRTMMAYSGPYSVEADRFETEVDLAWSPAWVGSRQVRFYHLVGDELRLTTAEQTHPAFPGQPGRAVLVWRRER